MRLIGRCCICEIVQDKREPKIIHNSKVMPISRSIFSVPKSKASSKKGMRILRWTRLGGLRSEQEAVEVLVEHVSIRGENGDTSPHIGAHDNNCTSGVVDTEDTVGILLGELVVPDKMRVLAEVLELVGVLREVVLVVEREELGDQDQLEKVGSLESLVERAGLLDVVLESLEGLGDCSLEIGTEDDEGELLDGAAGVVQVADSVLVEGDTGVGSTDTPSDLGSLLERPRQCELSLGTLGLLRRVDLVVRVLAVNTEQESSVLSVELAEESLVEIFNALVGIELLAELLCALGLLLAWGHSDATQLHNGNFGSADETQVGARGLDDTGGVATTLSLVSREERFGVSETLDAHAHLPGNVGRVEDTSIETKCTHDGVDVAASEV